LKEHIAPRYLGVSNQEMSARPSEDGVLRIVSCARVVPLKRLNLIAKALRLVRRRAEWTHIGGGTGLPDLQRIAAHLPPNVTARFTGHLTHSAVLQFYRDHPVDVFCTVSGREGLSVSLLEALSFGIPAIVTAVGGHLEIVNDRIGVLLPKAVTPSELAHVFDSFNIHDTRRQRAACEIQRSKFSAQTNYRAFAEEARAGFRSA
ncbi:MAG: glycosyltransferase, partial [Candidatus Peregrinibacteria bacterium]